MRTTDVKINKTKARGKRVGTRMSKRRRKELIFVLLTVALPVLQFAIFWVYVNFNSIIMGFQDIDGEWTLAHFVQFKKDFEIGLISRAVINSLINLGVAQLITLPLVVILSYLMYKKCYGSTFFRVLFYLPSLISAVVMASLFASLVTPAGSSDPGPILTIFQNFGVELSDSLMKHGLLGNKETAFFTIMVYCVWTGVGVNLVLLSGALARAPQDLFEAARIDGAGMFAEFRYVVVPILWPTITTLFIFNLAGCFTMYMPVMLLTNGNNETMTVGYFIIANTINRSGAGTLGYPAAVGLVFTAITMPVILLVRWGFNKISEAIEF